MRRLAALTVAVLLAGTLALPAAADTLTVGFPTERREVHGPIPAVIEVARLDTSAVAGQSCAGTFTAVNNDSEHSTDLLLDTNGTFVVALDIERGTAVTRDLGVFTVSDPSTTAPTGSSTTPSTLPPELPHTGATGAGTIAAAALVLGGLGGLSVRAGRRS